MVVVVVRKKNRGQKNGSEGIGAVLGRKKCQSGGREGGVGVVWGKKREVGESRDPEGESGNTRRDWDVKGIKED